MIKIKTVFSLLGISLLLFTACYNEGSVYYDELDITLTQYDENYSPNEYATFAVPDSTILRTNIKDFDVDAFYAVNGTSEKTLAALEDKFLELGYTLADSIGNADFVAVPSILLVNNTSAVYYPPGWWWGYPGWGYPGWGYPGYPWNPGYVSYYSYKTGTIALEMVDGDSYRSALEATEPTEGGELFIRWQATIDGYLSSNGEYNADRAQRGFNEAFDQSPYLKK